MGPGVFLRRLVSVAALPLSCIVAPVAPLGSASAAPPVEVYAAPPLAAQVSISPDGSHVAYLAPFKGKHALVVRKLLAGPTDEPRIITGDDWHIRWFEWVNEDRLVAGIGITAEIPGPSRDLPWRFTRLVATDKDGSNMRVVLEPNRRNPYYITSGDSVIQFIDREHILVAFPTGDDIWPDLVKVNVYTGKFEKVARGRHEVIDYLPDPTGEARIAYGYDDKNQTELWLVRPGRGHAFSVLRRVRPTDPAFRIFGFGNDPNLLYVASTHETDKAAVYEYDIRTGSFGRRVAEDPDYDVDGVIMRRGRVIGVSYTRDMPVSVYFDPADRKLQETLDKALPDSVEIVVERTGDGRFTLVASHHPQEPVTYRLLDRTTKRLDFFADTYPKLAAEDIGLRQAIRYAARDGVPIPGYLTLPPGRPATKLPFIILPHGGPHARDDQTFDPLSQFLAGRGYAVLQPNFRGSTGYGNAFADAGLREWGGRMQQDVIDGVRWAIDQGIADPARICIAGWSYGGYSALMGAIQDPGLFRCAIATAPVTNLPRLYREARWSFFKETIRGLYFGDDPDELKPVSPAHHADKVGVPVLLIHGEMDAQAYVQHSRDMVEALETAGKPHEYIEIEDMDHSPDSTEQMVRILTAWERFLATHIGPGAPSTGP